MIACATTVVSASPRPVLRFFSWSRGDDRKLRALYSHASWAELRAAFPIRTLRAIQQRASFLSLQRKADGKPHWTSAEEHRLKQLFGRACWDEMTAELPRHSRSAIQQRASALGLRRPPRCKLQSRYELIRALHAHRRAMRISRSQLADTMGVGKATIERWERGLCVPRLPMLFDWVQALELALVLQVAGGPAAAVIFRTAERAP